MQCSARSFIMPEELLELDKTNKNYVQIQNTCTVFQNRLQLPWTAILLILLLLNENVGVLTILRIFPALCCHQDMEYHRDNKNIVSPAHISLDQDPRTYRRDSGNHQRNLFDISRLSGPYMFWDKNFHIPDTPCCYDK